jgi:hypothetical protein
MIDLIRNTFVRQYGAALKMLENCVERADATDWLEPVGKSPFWHVVYHTLFFTGLYSSTRLETHALPEFHREGSQELGKRAETVFDKAMLVKYLLTCAAKADRAVREETETSLAGESGFHWLKFSRLELHIYNIRHIQHHTGQLNALLARRYGEGPTWVGSCESVTR